MRHGFLALGDSYTIGEGVPEAGRWPVQLAALLHARGIALDAPRIIATTGWTTDELDAGIDAANAADPIPTDHALVSLLIGVNNQYRGRPLAEYEVQFAGLLERAIEFAAGEASRVIVLAIPDWGVTPFAIQSGRDRAQIAADQSRTRWRGGDAGRRRPASVGGAVRYVGRRGDGRCGLRLDHGPQRQPDGSLSWTTRRIARSDHCHSMMLPKPATKPLCSSCIRWRLLVPSSTLTVPRSERAEGGA
jgi:hypothetical protein